jgi:hypothetical protein
MKQNPKRIVTRQRPFCVFVVSTSEDNKDEVKKTNDTNNPTKRDKKSDEDPRPWTKGSN